MHDLRATLPSEFLSEAARLAHAAGIEHVTVSEVIVNLEKARKMISVETSTPRLHEG